MTSRWAWKGQCEESVGMPEQPVARDNRVPSKTNRKEYGNGKDRHQRERLARRSHTGPGRRRGFQARRLAWSHWQPGSRRGGQSATRRGAGRRGLSVGSAELRVLGRPVAIPKWPIGGTVEQLAQVRRFLDPRSSHMEQHDGPKGRRDRRGLQAEAGDRWGNRRPR